MSLLRGIPSTRGDASIPTYVSITRSGSSGNRINLYNYPGETPVVDGINTNTSGHPVFQISGTASWWHIKGLEIKNGHSYGISIRDSSHDIIIENNDVHHSPRVNASGAGITICCVGNTVSNVLILNNDVHDNGVPNTTGGDGISITYNLQSGNIVRGNRSWRNNDDGFDFWDSRNVLAENNWAWENGLGVNSGNGAGLHQALRLWRSRWRWRSYDPLQPRLGQR